MKILLIILFLISFAHARTKPKRLVKIKTYDKISFIKHALMTRATSKNGVVKFEWEQPHSDFQYYLVIYRHGIKRPIGTMLVENRSKTLKFKNERKKLFWRVFAKSKHGNVTSNKKKFLVPLK